MLVSEIGEFGLIGRLRTIVAREDPTVDIGIGDDAAVVRYNRPVVLTTDALVAGVHFRADLIDYRSVGYKAMAASLSDVAVMGAEPRHALVTLVLPRDQEVEPLLELYAGVAQAGELYSVTVVGGDVVSTDGPLTISVSMTGELSGERPLRRGDAQPGDLVFVTGDVGASGAYVHWKTHLPSGHLSEEDAWVLRLRHIHPVPQLAAGRELALCGFCGATDDVSDGLSSELHEIAQASGVRIVLEEDRIPTLPAVRHYARLAGLTPTGLALTGGEDYQIVGTVASGFAGRLLGRMEAIGVRVTLIGRVEEGAPGVDLSTGSGRVELVRGGYDHFRGEEQGGAR